MQDFFEKKECLFFYSVPVGMFSNTYRKNTFSRGIPLYS